MRTRDHNSIAIIARAVAALLLGVLSVSVAAESNADSTAPSRAGEDEPGVEWREWFRMRGDPLNNKPVVVSRKKKGNGVVVTVANKGKTTLMYQAVDITNIQLFQETQHHGAWRKGMWDWCGTGKSTYSIEPGKQVELYVDFWDKYSREKMLGAFSEKGTNRSGLVVLAIEPGSE